MPYEFKLTRRVEFSETDMAGIVHYSNFFRYMEAAEHAFLRSLGHSVFPREEGHTHGWPRVHASCDYRRPVRFEDRLEIHLLVRQVRTRSIFYEFIFRLEGESEEIARGKLVVASVERAADGSMRATPIPAEIAGKIEAAPAELFG